MTGTGTGSSKTSTPACPGSLTLDSNPVTHPEEVYQTTITVDLPPSCFPILQIVVNNPSGAFTTPNAPTSSSTITFTWTAYSDPGTYETGIYIEDSCGCIYRLSWNIVSEPV